ncbi:MAG: nucleotidyltransferase family protein [Pseudoxanthomonas sp.]
MQAAPVSAVDVRAWLAAVLRASDGSVLPAPAAPPAQVLAIAEREGVTALVHERLREQPDAGALHAAFAEATRRQAMWSLWLRAETARLLAALQAAGLRTLVLKGVALAGWLYPAAHLRACGDLDLLFASRADAQRAMEVLDGFGYPCGYAQGGHAYEQVRKPAADAAQALEVDVHWRLLNAPVFADALDFEALWSAAISIPALGPHARGLGPVHALLHAAMNRAVNLYTDVGDLLKCLYDIHLLAARFDDAAWAAVVQAASQRQLCGVVQAALAAAQAQLGTTVPGEVMAALAQRITAEPLDPQRLGDWSYMQRRSVDMLPFGQRLRWMLGRLVPTAGYLRARHGADASVPVLLLRHWWRFVLRLSGRHSGPGSA